MGRKRETQLPLRTEEIKCQLSLLLSFFDVLYTLLTGTTVHNPLLLSCGLCWTVEMVKETDSLDFWPQTFHKDMWPWEQTHQTQANPHNWVELSRFQEIDKVLPWMRSRWESALTLDNDKTVRYCLTTYLCTQTHAVEVGDVLDVFDSGFTSLLTFRVFFYHFRAYIKKKIFYSWLF